MTKRVLFFASGRGSNFQSFVDHLKLGVLQNVSFEALFCNRKGAEVLERARSAGIPTEQIEGVAGKTYSDSIEREKARKNFDNKCLEMIAPYRPDIIVLAGFDQLLGKDLVNSFHSKILNIHPAYDLARFGGRNMVGERVHQKVLASNVKYSGCTVHIVTKDIDRGPPILKRKIPILPNDTPEALEERILIQEHLAYPKALQLVTDERVIISEGRCFVDFFGGGWDISWAERQDSYLTFQGCKVLMD